MPSNSALERQAHDDHHHHLKEPTHRALHPFGQIPTYEEGDLALFETGAIDFHVAQHHAGLLPKDANARARAMTWMFAATGKPPAQRGR